MPLPWHHSFRVEGKLVLAHPLLDDRLKNKIFDITVFLKGKVAIRTFVVGFYIGLVEPFRTIGTYKDLVVKSAYPAKFIFSFTSHKQKFPLSN